MNTSNEQEPTESGYYWIYCNNPPDWEVAYWNGKSWDVISREYPFTSVELGLIRWAGPLNVNTHV